MLINNSVGSFSGLYQTEATRPLRQSRATQVRSFRDEMKLSAEAQNFNDMLKKLRQSSEVRRDKVEEYSARIADGSYFTSAAEIASSMLGLQY